MCRMCGFCQLRLVIQGSGWIIEELWYRLAEVQGSGWIIEELWYDWLKLEVRSAGVRSSGWSVDEWIVLKTHSMTEILTL